MNTTNTMDKLKKQLAGLAGIIVATVIVCMSLAMGTPDGLGPQFQGVGGTNTWNWSSSNMAPQLSYFGSNFTGQTLTIMTTNLGSGTTNRLTFVNGLLVGTNNSWSF